MLRAVVRGVGGYLPARVMTNIELSGLVDTTDEWIRDRTGIGQRATQFPVQLGSLIRRHFRDIEHE